MNKAKIKNFSIWARRHLVETVAYNMRFLGIDENGIKEELPASTNTLKLYDMGTGKPAEVTESKISKRSKLVEAINKKCETSSDYKTAYESIIEEISYTWFNRIIAIRFMEVNDYLPSGVRVLSSESGKNEPDIVTQAEAVAEDQEFSITKEEIWKLKDENKLDELFRIMFSEQCKKLHNILPELFENNLDDYYDLLIPISFIDKDGIICKLVSDIDEDDFNISKEGQVEIIGWLYQYYNTEPKDTVFANLKKNIKISKENIAPATQLFTPDWIVRYMVENSLGRLWLEGHPESELKKEWKYYLDEAEQTEEVAEQLVVLRNERKNLSPEDITFIDPCMGSGHILVYAFDVLMQIYLSCGYTNKDAVRCIVTKNLYGLDLDKRAYQLTYFAIMMKAKQYDKRFFSRKLSPNISHFQDIPQKADLLDEPLKSFVKQFENADNFGSLITVKADENIDSALSEFNGNIFLNVEQIEHLMVLYKILSKKYDVVCTNPPYMGSSNMNSKLSDFVKKNYPDSKSDLFAVFIEKCGEFAKSNGFYSMITQHAWMFLLSYEKLREKLALKTTVNMAHLGARAFDEIGGEVVQTTAFVNYNSHIKDYKGTYVRLVDIVGENEKREQFINKTNQYISQQDDFSKIPGQPTAYWASTKFVSLFDNPKLGCINDVSNCIQPGDSNLFLRYWYEIKQDKINHNWRFVSKGGSYRKWYGNIEYVLNYGNNGEPLLRHPNTTLRTPEKYFQMGFVWSRISTGPLSARIWTKEKLVTDAGPIMYCNKLFYLGLLNCNVSNKVLQFISPTINYQVGNIANIPVVMDESSKENIDDIVNNNIIISKSDWDSYETSWDFKKNPLI